MILGQAEHNALVDMPAGSALLRQVDVSDTGLCVAMICALMDGQGTGSGDATVHPIIYSAASDLLTIGPGVVVADGDDEAWVTLRLDLPGVLIGDGAWIGIYATGAAGAARISQATLAGKKTLDVSGGVPASMSGATASARDASVFCDAFEQTAIPDVDSSALARLPWDLSQRAFAATGPISSSLRTSVIGWHGRDTDPEPGANAIARTDGPLADLVGQRLQVTYRVGTLERKVLVYCHTEQAFPDAPDEDLSLTRSAMLRLAPLALESVSVEIEVLA